MVAVQELAGKEELSLVLDDCADKWPDNQVNLVLIPKYEYPGLCTVPAPMQDECVIGGPLALAADFCVEVHAKMVEDGQEACSQQLSSPVGSVGLPRWDARFALKQCLQVYTLADTSCPDMCFLLSNAYLSILLLNCSSDWAWHRQTGLQGKTLTYRACLTWPAHAH